MPLPANFKELNTNYLRGIGLLAPDEQTGNGLADIRLSQNPDKVAAYVQWRKTYDPQYSFTPLPGISPNQNKTPLDQQQANQVNNPSLPNGTNFNATPITANPNEFINNTPPLGNMAPVTTTPVTPQQPTATQGTASQVDPNTVTSQVNPNAGQTTANLTTNIGAMPAAQGTVQPLDTVQGQLANLYSQFANGQIPDWAKGAMTKANEEMAARGISNSSLAGVAIAEAIQQNAIQIAAPDAATYFNMDMTNLSNQQQANLQTYQATQQDMLTDTSIKNATAQFNATNAQQVNEFVASTIAQITQQNADRANTMTQFNTAQDNSMKALNANNALDADKFNQQQLASVNEFNSTLQNNRDQFNGTMQFAIDQSNVLWRRTVNTANTASANAAAQANTQNMFNLSQTALNNLWQQWSDEAAMNFTASQNEKDRNFNLAMSASNQSFINTQNNAITPAQILQQVGSFAANLLR